MFLLTIRRGLVLFVGLFLCGTSAAADALLERMPYQAPFQNYSDWLAFMDKADDSAWQAPSVRRWVDHVAFERCANNDEIEVETFRYLSDGLSIRAFMATPTDARERHPVILFAHGGVAQWGRVTFFDILEMCRLAEKGYVVIAPTLRGEGGSEGRANLGAGEVSDMLNLIRVVRGLGAADPERIGIWGFSRGGGLTYRLLAATNQLKAAVVVGAPADHLRDPRRAEFDEHVYPDVVDGYTEDPNGALRQISAVYWPEKIHAQTPLLLLHGQRDVRVGVEQSLRMASALRGVDHPNMALQIFDQGSHTLIEQRDRMRAAIDYWFDTYLK
ncbi:MAG: alpha/beta hydrolase family protein [Gammaproteobacteria bacterium]